MFGAKATVPGTASFHCGQGGSGVNGELRPAPGSMRRLSPPDHSLEGTMLRASFLEHDLITLSNSLGRYASKAFRTNALCLGKYDLTSHYFPPESSKPYSLSKVFTFS